MTKISGINQKNFLSQTKSALEAVIGSPLKSPSKVRQFITNQFKLPNEHLIKEIFSDEPSASTDNSGAPEGGDITRLVISNKLKEKTQSHARQREILMDFLEKNCLMSALQEHISAQEEDEPNQNLKARFMHDIDCLVSDLHDYAREKADNVIMKGAIVLEDQYAMNGRIDLTAAKYFMSAFGSELEYQYRPLYQDKGIKNLINRIKKAF